ncbi:ATP synthase subunit C lysine N-methyltransferase isoform X1 [Diabrotica virgifera virgifera]|uniref:Protein N-lysine methyltransferase FAM173B isoform X1 n=1 Tax=Diabrotica virgifera virgifera TaxID=50390 RepID=A0A6P7FWC0_DIAVI|nr:ATP synthase subunit C lysine N-methyltransferase isoform X1 [Diabrotica virgifera virgifera]
MNTLFETSEQTEPRSLPKKISPAGKFFVAITGGVAIGLTVICAPFISPAFRKYCLPYIPATDHQVKNILAALKGRTGTLLDLGSGDGRIVLETAKNKFISHGVELNPWLVLFSKISALREGITNAKFYRRDLWKYSIHQYDNIVIFGVEQMMNDLEKKFIKECKSSCKIIACRFPLPNLTPIKTIGHGIDTVWVYGLK